jgi:O-antigen/teichoic acid export membrane protein
MLRVIVSIGILQFLCALMGLVRSKVVAVLAGPEGVGLISIIDQVVQTIAQFSALSLPYASMRFLSRSHSEGPDVFRACYAAFLKGLLILSCAGMFVAIGLLLVRPDIFGAEIYAQKHLLLIALFGVPPAILSGFLINVLAAARRPNTSATVGLITAVALAISSSLGILLAGVGGLYVGNVLFNLLIVAGVLAYVRSKLGLPMYDRGASMFGELRRNRDIIPFAALQYFATLMYSCSFLAARYTVLRGQGELSTGLLQAVMALSMALGTVLNPANGLFLTPMMNRTDLTANDKIRKAVEFQKKLLLILAVVALPLALFPEFILTILFSAKFVVAGRFLALFVVWQVLLQLAGVYQSLLIGLDDLKAYTAITAGAYVASMVLFWWLTPVYGITGVGIGFCASGAIILVLGGARLGVKHRFAPSRSLFLLLAYVVTVLLLAGKVTALVNPTPTGLFIKGASYAGAVACLWLFLNQEERNALRDVIRTRQLRRLFT